MLTVPSKHQWNRKQELKYSALSPSWTPSGTALALLLREVDTYILGRVQLQNNKSNLAGLVPANHVRLREASVLTGLTVQKYTAIPTHVKDAFSAEKILNYFHLKSGHILRFEVIRWTAAPVNNVLVLAATAHLTLPVSQTQIGADERFTQRTISQHRMKERLQNKTRNKHSAWIELDRFDEDVMVIFYCRGTQQAILFNIFS